MPDPTPTPRITGFHRREDTTIRLPFEGDNWHTTWAEDGEQYALMCDGQGYNTRLWQLRGDPPDLSFMDLPGYPELESRYPPEPGEPVQFSRYYGFGIIALDGAIYHFLSTPNRNFAAPEPRFAGA
jgi:hypothetical protein